ncbi:MAG: ABC transporter permease subunit, partial [Chloroflexota bacterium]
SWLSTEFLQTPMSSVPAQAGIRTALYGSIIMMVIVILVSLPVGVAAAIYLEEYARDNVLSRFPLVNINKIIETNVRNLAGVPSIIYGMLGLAIFVRMLAPFTSGVVFGINVNPPPTNRIVNLMEEPTNLELDLELDENYNITAYTGPEWLSENDAQRVVTLFRRYGTPSVTNRGNVPIERIESDIANILGIRIRNQVPANADELDYLRVASGFVELSTLPAGMTIEQFESLGQQLRRVSGFTLSGRTVLSAALTLSLLILPVIIINAQEALRAVPNALREASYGLGATKWQTIWKTILPAAVPGIMTGTILAVSRAVGETAPLIVVGASTFLLTDPNGPFSQFTALPIQVYQWTARPQGQFQFIAAAAIIVLLTMVLVLNAVAIIIRSRFDNRY